jgi:predicted dienelactone hydrolase
MSTFRSSVPGVLVALFSLGSSWVRADASQVFPPQPLPGPYAVACSNVVQDFNRVAAGEDVQLYWEGVPRADGTPRYATDLLSDPANTLQLAVVAPDNSSLYGSFAGKTVPYVVVVCYPTTSGNPRPDYGLPTGKRVPHMQRGSEPPLWPDATTRFPLLLFSNGYGGSPLSNDYIVAVSILASYGYVVAAPFHGDSRFSKLQLENFTDFLNLLTHLKDFIALQALRPLSLSATIDLLLAHPQWRDRIDAAKIGGFGASLGGESILLMAGAGLTTSVGQSWSTVTTDPRLKAAVGYVPYFGVPILPAFGRGQHGLDGIALPYLAISGTLDTTAPIVDVMQGINRLAGTRELVALFGVKHGFDVPSTDDIFTWSVTFLDAEVRGDPVARDKLQRMASVAGGGDDRVVIPYNGVAPANYGGIWWNASESGWGITFAHQGDTIFATWLTYDLAGNPWWLAMTAVRTTGATYAGTLYQTRGPAFSAMPFNPDSVAATMVGPGTLTFANADNGTFAYTVAGMSQTKSITRQIFGSVVPTCSFGAQPDLTLAANYQDMWWAAPEGSEAGWGVSLTHQGNTIFAVWFTYGFDGMPLWQVATAVQTAPGTYAGTLYRTHGPAFNAVPFTPASVIATPVGTASFMFSNGNSATFSYTVDGVSQTKHITREVFVAPGTVCQ